jgi:hypothetical protein
MAAKSSGAEIAILLYLVDQSFGKKAWHGPNLRGSIRRLTAVEAAWRPGPNRRSIADIVVHAAYWKYAVRRRLRGDKRGSFALQGSNWFPLPSPLEEAHWREYVAILDAQHKALRETVAEFPANRLYRSSPGSRYTAMELICGIASHDVYHAGQIQILKRLLLQEGA